MLSPKPHSYLFRFRQIAPSLAAFLFYGGWGFFANHLHPFAIATKAALTQGCYSFLITLALSSVMEFLYSNCPWPNRRGITTVSVTCLILYSTSWGINALMATPEILATILPGAIIGTIYTILYCIALNRAEGARIRSGADSIRAA